MISGFYTREARIEGRRTLDRITRGPHRVLDETAAQLLDEHVRAIRQMATRAAHLGRMAMLTEPRSVREVLRVEA